MSGPSPHDSPIDDADGARLEALIEREIELARRRAELDAELAEHYAEVVDHCRETAGDDVGAKFDARFKSMAAELGLATRVSDRTILVRLDDAVALRDFYPRALEALRKGRISVGHARVIAAAGAPLITDDERRERYERLVLPHAYERTPGRLRPIAERLVAELDPEGADAAHEVERRHRDVRVREVGSGMSELVAALPSVMAHAIHDRLTQLAQANLRDRRERWAAAAAAAATEPIPYEGAFGRAVIDPERGAVLDPERGDDSVTGDGTVASASSGYCASHAADPGVGGCAPDGTAPDIGAIDDRRFGDVRADALVELLLTGRVDDHSRHAAINAIQARVAITVPALAAIGVDDAPAMLDGVAPIPIDTALRLCAGASQWIRVLTDPVSGAPIAADTYRPGAELRRFLEVRDGTCRMPGCGRPARFCDTDHTKAWVEGGRTEEENTAMLCRYHHTLKHARWNLEQRSSGELVWTAPSGRTYIEHPAPIARPWPGGPGREPPGGPGAAGGGAPPGGNAPPGESASPAGTGSGCWSRPEFQPTADDDDESAPF